MKTREQFGEYILLKKLTEDALGETFRAGRLGGQGMEQVVLLRVLNGPAVEDGNLAQKLTEWTELAKVLKSPNIGNCVDAGEVRSVPYVAYDYISGKNLSSLFAQAAKRNNPIPTDHALLITERMALALTVAYETRLQTERILHGFLVPQLVMLSNEGENRLLGFEASSGLRELAPRAATREHFGRYLSPESLAGEPLAKTDDVYSLGVILLELLIGEHLPTLGDRGYAPLIDQAVVAADGGQIPDPVATLLKQSLAPRDERIQDVVSWHKSLTKLMIEGQYRPTTFNLAFFMHNLFREEIERESHEIEVEKTIELPLQELSEELGDLGIEEPQLPSVPVAGQEDTSAVRARYELERPARKRRLLITLLAAVVVAVLAAGGYFGFSWWQSRVEVATPEPIASERPPVEPVSQVELQPEAEGEDGAEAEPEAEAEAEPEAPPGPTPEELEEQIAKIIDDRTRSMEASFRAQYDEKIRTLQRQLEEARKEAAAQASREQAATPPAAAKETDSKPATALAEDPAAAETKVATRQPTPRAAVAAGADVPGSAAEEGTKPTQELPASTSAGAPTTASGPAASSQQPTASESRPAAGAAARPATGAPKQTAPSTSPPQPTTPPPVQVRRGELVELGPGVRPPRLKRLPNPQYPPLAMKMRREAEVVVRVLVDENGRVLEAKLRDTKKKGYGFDEAALKVARQAIFTPATKAGVAVKTWTTVRIDFELK